MKVKRFDHLVLTVANLERTCTFYREVLDAEVVAFAPGRMALYFAGWKINLHQMDNILLPHAQYPTAGSADLCVIVDESMDRVVARLLALELTIEEGPVRRTGRSGAITSVYIRDPDGNLLELANEDGGGE